MKEVYGKSWKSLFNNLILLLPDVTYAIILAIAVFLFGYFSGLLEFFINFNAEDFIFQITEFFSNNLGKIIVSFMGFVIATFFVGVGKDIVKYVMVLDVVKGKKALIRDAWGKKRNFYTKVIMLKIKIFLIYLAISIFFGSLLGLTAIDDVGNYKWVWLIIMTSILFLIFTIIGIILMFRYPIMFTENYNSTNTIKESFRMFRKQYGKFFIVLLILFATQFGISMAISIIASSAAYLGFIFNLIAGFFLTVWKDLYIFYSYGK